MFYALNYKIVDTSRKRLFKFKDKKLMLKRKLTWLQGNLLAEFGQFIYQTYPGKKKKWKC